MEEIKDILMQMLAEQKKTNQMLGDLITQQKENISSAIKKGEQQREIFVNMVKDKNPALAKMLEQIGG